MQKYKIRRDRKVVLKAGMVTAAKDKIVDADEIWGDVEWLQKSGLIDRISDKATTVTAKTSKADKTTTDNKTATRGGRTEG